MTLRKEFPSTNLDRSQISLLETVRSKRKKRKAGRSPELERMLRRAARRSRRSISKERYVETLVVVDKTMIEFYRGQDLQQYVLTVMNMVCEMIAFSSTFVKGA